MISVIMPLDPNLDYTLTTLISIIELLKGAPFEVLYLRREGSKETDSLLRGGSYKFISSKDLDIGLAFNLGVASSDSSSKYFFFVHPGIVLKPIPRSELVGRLEQNPFNLVGYNLANLRSPFGEVSQDFLSWSSLLTTREAFRSFGGFSEYLPVMGGDFLYCLQCMKRGGTLSQIRDGHFLLNSHLVTDADKIKIHRELMFKRLPIICVKEKLSCKVLLNWPGVVSGEKP